MNTPPFRSPQEQDLRIPVGPVALHGHLTVPSGARSLIVFAHGSGSSRLSPRNRFVAETLQQYGFGTLLFDLLTTEEEAVDRHTAHLRFDIPLLADRLVGVTDWLRREPALSGLQVGYFGASTGAAAALAAAAARPEAVGAVVSRGGRPDLAGDALPRVQAPTLLIVGERDEAVIAMNEQACGQMTAPTEVWIVPGATHLFEEPGALEQAAQVAAGWFERHLPGRLQAA